MQPQFLLAGAGEGSLSRCPSAHMDQSSGPRVYHHLSPSLSLSLFLSLIMISSDLSAASSSADALIGGRVVPATKHQYQGKGRAIKDFYAQHRIEFNLPVHLQQIRAFFGWLIDVRHKNKSLALSSVRSYKSALVWWYKEHKLIIQPDVNQELETLLTGYKRRLSDFKLDGKMPVFEGKYHLTFDGYRVLATQLLKAEFNQMLFGWPYLVLQWNLIARTATVSSMMMEHIGWEADALLITTPKHKGDQEGVKCFARHLYANPSTPAICPVLALAILLFVRSVRHDPASDSHTAAPANFRVFDGSQNCARFSEILLRTIAAVPASDVHLLGGERSSWALIESARVQLRTLRG